MARKDLNLNVSLHKKVKEKYDTCLYCGKKLSLHERTLDHIVPLDLGGEDIEENMAVACKTCNQDKSNIPLEDYLRLVEEGYFTREAKDERKRANNKEILKYLAPDTQFEVVMMNLIDITLPRSHSKPADKTFKSRKNNYLETGRFNRTAFVEKITKRNGEVIYMLRQGFTNYYVSLELGLPIMEVVLYDRKDRVIMYKSEMNRYKNRKKAKVLERNKGKVH